MIAHKLARSMSGGEPMTLTADELEQVEEYIFRRLPLVLAKDPDFATVIEGILAEKFPRRDEFARLLDELTASRQEQREGFARLDGRVDSLEQRVDVLQVGQEEMRTDVKALQAGQEELRAGQEELRTDVKTLQVGQEELRTGQEDLRLLVDQRTDELRLLVDRRSDDLRKELSDSVARVGQRWGIVTEDVLRQVVKGIVQETYGGQVRELNIEGEQYDCVITDGEHILLEITTRARQEIIRRLRRKRDTYVRHTGVEPTRVILATAQIHLTVARRLQELGFEVIQPDVLIEGEGDDSAVAG